MNRRTGLVAALLAALVVVAGCSGDDTVPAGEPTANVPSPAGAAELTEPPEEEPAEQDCGDPTASYRPRGALPAPTALPPGSTMARIRQEGALIVGVDQNTYNFGYRDPFTGEIEGFDIDMARAIARAIFGRDDALQLRVLTSAQRIPALQEGQVHLVVRTMTINCERLADVDFSSVYYEANQRVLVKEGSGYTGIESLGGEKVCAAADSTSLRRIATAPSRPVPVQVANWTDCLVMLQQNQVEAVSTDDTILAGFVAQDPFTEIVGEPLGAEPYGIAFPKGQTEFVRFVNGVLEQMRADGSWQANYNRWLSGILGQAPAPPAARYRD